MKQLYIIMFDYFIMVTLSSSLLLLPFFVTPVHATLMQESGSLYSTVPKGFSEKVFWSISNSDDTDEITVSLGTESDNPSILLSHKDFITIPANSTVKVPFQIKVPKSFQHSVVNDDSSLVATLLATQSFSTSSSNDEGIDDTSNNSNDQNNSGNPITIQHAKTLHVTIIDTPTPHYQTKVMGISPADVICKDAMRLMVLQGLDRPACVNFDSVISLEQRGWELQQNLGYAQDAIGGV